jgi:hypothetical protein
MKLPSIQPKLCRFIQKRAILLQFPQNRESIITLKKVILYSIAKKHPGITISDIKSGIFEMKRSNPE